MATIYELKEDDRILISGIDLIQGESEETKIDTDLAYIGVVLSTTRLQTSCQVTLWLEPDGPEALTQPFPLTAQFDLFKG